MSVEDQLRDYCWVCGEEILADDNFCRNCGVRFTRPETPHDGVLEIKRTKQRLVGIFLMAAGGLVGALSVLMGITPMIAMGLASLLIGVMVLYLPLSESYVRTLTTNLSLPSLLNIEKLLEDLDLVERGIYIPTKGYASSPRVFVPLARTPATDRPTLELLRSNKIFVTVGRNPEDRGILLEAPGSGILQDLERAIHADFSQTEMENLASNLDSGFRSVGLGRIVRVERHEASMIITMKVNALDDLEMKLRSEAPRLVAQIGTPVSSAVASAVSKVAGKYVVFKSTAYSPPDKKVTIKLRLR